MPAPASLEGDALLDAISDAMAALHKRYYHRSPVSTKTMLLGDELLVCVMGGVYTEVEKTMIELQRTSIVQENRSAFQDAHRHRIIADVQRLSGREVLTFTSSHSVGPDMEIELFFLAAKETTTT